MPPYIRNSVGVAHVIYRRTPLPANAQLLDGRQRITLEWLHPVLEKNPRAYPVYQAIEELEDEFVKLGIIHLVRLGPFEVLFFRFDSERIAIRFVVDVDQDDDRFEQAISGKRLEARLFTVDQSPFVSEDDGANTISIKEDFDEHEWAEFRPADEASSDSDDGVSTGKYAMYESEEDKFEANTSEFGRDHEGTVLDPIDSADEDDGYTEEDLQWLKLETAVPTPHSPPQTASTPTSASTNTRQFVLYPTEPPSQPPQWIPSPAQPTPQPPQFVLYPTEPTPQASQFALYASHVNRAPSAAQTRDLSPSIKQSVRANAIERIKRSEPIRPKTGAPVIADSPRVVLLAKGPSGAKRRREGMADRPPGVSRREHAAARKGAREGRAACPW